LNREPEQLPRTDGVIRYSTMPRPSMLAQVRFLPESICAHYRRAKGTKPGSCRRVSPIFVLVLVLALSGCAETRHYRRHESVLQRFDLMQGSLDTVTLWSMRVAGDLSRVRRPLRAGQVGSIRKSAHTLDRDAMRLLHSAGSANYSLRTLGHRKLNPHVRAYLHILSAVLSAQWWEAHALRGVAAILTQDPDLEDGRSLTSFAREVSRARHSAARAHALVQSAQRLRAQFPRAFRYIPVRVTSTRRSVP
jgi:hypothetical protein